MKNVSVEFTCKICGHPGATEASPAACDASQRAFDVLYPALVHNRCFDWRQVNVVARERCQKLGGVLEDARREGNQKIEKAAEAQIRVVLERFMAENCRYLCITYRQPDALVRQITANPRAAFQAVRNMSLALHREATQAINQ
jgi:hypothetical protein